MNLYIRLFKTLLLIWLERGLKSIHDISRLTFRVWPNDLDMNMHMNNGRYFTLMDLGRTDLMLRAGLMKYLKTTKAAPVLAGATMRFRKALDFWQKFTLESRVLCWDDRWFYMEQRFIFATGEDKGRIAAIGIVRGGLYGRKRKGMLPPAEIIAAMNGDEETESPPMPDHVREWAESEEALKQAVRAMEKIS